MADDDAFAFRSRRGSPEAKGEPRAVAEPLRRLVADLVLETAVEGIWLIDAGARTTFVNRRLADLLGYAEEEMIGESIFSFIDRERWPIAEKNLRERELGIEDRQEVQLVRKDGTRVWVLGSANPLFDRNGEYAGSLALIGELTTQKDRERRLRAQVDDLRSRLVAKMSSGASSGAPSVAASVATPEPAPYREPFRTAVVVATYGTLLATIAIVTTGALVGALFGSRQGPPET